MFTLRVGKKPVLLSSLVSINHEGAEAINKGGKVYANHDGIISIYDIERHAHSKSKDNIALIIDLVPLLSITESHFGINAFEKAELEEYYYKVIDAEELLLSHGVRPKYVYDAISTFLYEDPEAISNVFAHLAKCLYRNVNEDVIEEVKHIDESLRAFDPFKDLDITDFIEEDESGDGIIISIEEFDFEAYIDNDQLHDEAHCKEILAMVDTMVESFDEILDIFRLGSLTIDTSNELLDEYRD